jgi:fructokinase
LASAAAVLGQYPNPTVYFFDRANPATVWLADEYARRGCLVVFEPSVSPDAALLHRALELARVVKHSDDYVLPSAFAEPTTREQIRITTHGASGLEVRHGRRRAHVLPAFATLAVDTAGAGDWTTAGFLHHFAKIAKPTSSDIISALRFGQALAALNCSTLGARGIVSLTRRTVLCHVKAALREGGVSTAPRLRAPEHLHSVSGTCPSCLMPTGAP